MKITFAVKNINGYSHKLIVNTKSKEFETGQCCINSSFVDVWVTNQKGLKEIMIKLVCEGYKKTDDIFKEEN